MSETPVIDPPDFDEPSPPDPSSRPRPFRRSQDERWIAGVCGGIAEHFDIDVVLVRIAFAVLCFFGGVSIAAYVAIWALVPDDMGPAPAERFLRNRTRTGTRGRNVPGIVLIVFAAAIIAGGLRHLVWWWTPVPFLGLLAVGIVVLLARRRAARVTAAVVLVVLLAGAVTTLAFGPSLTSREVVVTDPSGLQDYHQGVGTLKLDFSHLAPLATDEDVTVTVGSGRADIVLPAGIAAHIDARTGIGSVELLGDDAHGFGSSRTIDTGTSGGQGRLYLDVHVGVGDAKITQGASA